jgi:hypothetical protein
MTNPLLKTLVKNRIFLREGTQIEPLLEHQKIRRPITAMFSVSTGDRSLVENFRISQAVVNNCPKSTFAVQLFHEQSGGILLVFSDNTVDDMVQYVKEQVAKHQQPGYILINHYPVNFFTNDDVATIGVDYNGSIEHINRYANWIIPEFNVTGYIDNSNSYKQEMDHRYAIVQ